jgi:hypothetical protein
MIAHHHLLAISALLYLALAAANLSILYLALAAVHALASIDPATWRWLIDILRGPFN